MKRLSSTVSFVLLLAAPLHAQIDVTEHQMVAAVDANRVAAVRLLERAVNINSGSLNFAGVRRVGDLFRAELDALGFVTEWIDGAPFGRAGHLVATRTGRGARLLLIGHLDTVFEEGSPFQQMEFLPDSMARGPGVIDMKGGNVIIIEALKALAAAKVLQDMSITVVMTGDEERSGDPLDLARKALIDAADAADIAIGFENGDSDPRTAVIARRSSGSWKLTVRGKPAHSSQIFRPEVGFGAIYEAARILTAFRDQLASEQYLTFNPGLMLAGTDVDYTAAQAGGSAFGKNNVIAEHAVVSGDLRAISPEQIARAQARMQAIVRAHLPHTEATIEFDDSYPPLAPTDGNRQLLAYFDRVSRDLGFGPVTAVDPTMAGAADISFTTGYVEMAMDGLGAGGADDHTVDETIDLRTLAMQAKRAAVFMYRLTRVGTP